MTVAPTTRVGRAVQAIARTRGFARVAPHVVPHIDRALHRLTGGRFVLGDRLVPTIVMTTTGAKTGLARQTPVAALPDGDGYYVVASNFGREHHPAWSANLLANPEVSVSHHGRDRAMRARLLADEEKAGVWPHLLQIWPSFDVYVERSGRNIRVFRLEPL